MKAYERLIKYASYPSASCEKNESCPSTPTQTEFGKALVSEMNAIGISNARIDKDGYVYGEIPATKDCIKTVGFIAHMDVVEEVPYENIKTKIVEKYDGSVIVMNEALNITMSPEEFPVLKDYIGDDLLITDGTTLLGADDKAGIAEIMTMAETLINNPSIEHGKIVIGFTPDEEIGRGADRFDVSGFGADFAYTLDGAAFGEITYETFNAASAKITLTGKSIHPGEAKNKMKNASRIAMEFNSMLPEAEKPEHTEKYEGFYHLTEMSGGIDKAQLNYILRDHDSELLENKKKTVLAIAEYLNSKYGENTAAVEIKDAYRNMAEKVLEHKYIVDIAYAATKKAGGEPFTEPMRGGTDGAVLTFKGLPCPNLGTGSHNHHGKNEFASIQGMDKCVESLINIAEAVAEM